MKTENRPDSEAKPGWHKIIPELIGLMERVPKVELMQYFVKLCTTRQVLDALLYNTDLGEVELILKDIGNSNSDHCGVTERVIHTDGTKEVIDTGEGLSVRDSATGKILCKFALDRAE